MKKIHPLRAFSDNIIWMIVDDSGRYGVAVDPGDSGPVIDFCNKNNLTLQGILITHHHHDHTGGIARLGSRWKVPVFGPSQDRIEGVTDNLKDGGSFVLEKMGGSFKAIETPGHTKGHLVYLYSDASGMHLFTGDTLFAGGCGRIFEGSADDMYHSLMKISGLPETTFIYPGHDYLLNNFNFIQLLEPDNRELNKFLDDEILARKRGDFSPATDLKREKKINPFLRCGSTAMRKMAERRSGKSLPDEGEVFRVLREWKNEI